MTCATCRRLRQRIAEEYSKLKRAIAPHFSGPVQPRGNGRKAAADRQGRPISARQQIAIRQARISRRETLKSLLAGAAIASGLARTELELVDEPEIVVRYMDPSEWWINHADADAQIRRLPMAELERAWFACVNGGQQPDLILVVDDGRADPLEQLRKRYT